MSHRGGKAPHQLFLPALVQNGCRKKPHSSQCSWWPGTVVLKDNPTGRGLWTFTSTEKCEEKKKLRKTFVVQWHKKSPGICHPDGHTRLLLIITWDTRRGFLGKPWCVAGYTHWVGPWLLITSFASKQLLSRPSDIFQDLSELNCKAEYILCLVLCVLSEKEQYFSSPTSVSCS